MSRSCSRRHPVFLFFSPIFFFSITCLHFQEKKWEKKSRGKKNQGEGKNEE
jgi:hypothetical protein